MKSEKIGEVSMVKPRASDKRLYFTKDALVLVAMVATLLSLISCSTASPPAPGKSISTVSLPPPGESKSTVAFQEGVPGGVMVNTVEVSARVAAIDHFNREVTLLESDGEKFTVKVGPDAVNFDQIQVGDLVKATVAEELVAYLNEEGSTPVGGSAAIMSLGAQAGGLAAETTQLIGTVTAIDLEKRTVTLRFQDGSTKTFPVRSDIDLSERKLGEQVVFHITEMIAIRVEKP